MPWERGYYYRATKQGGRVVREYFGAGRVAELAAEEDALERERRRRERRACQAEMSAHDTLATCMGEMSRLADLAARAALAAAGYRQHKRGEWRKRREQVTSE